MLSCRLGPVDRVREDGGISDLGLDMQSSNAK